MPFVIPDFSTRRLPRRHLLWLALAGVAAPCLARATAPSDPGAPIGRLYSALAALMKLGTGVPFHDRFERIAPVIDSSFDLPSILRSSIGPRWTMLEPGAQDALGTAFRRFTIASYVANFDRDDGEQFETVVAPRPIGVDQVVQTRIIQRNGDPTRLDYVMRQSGTGWRVVDILLDGTISRVAVQRADFRAVLQGGDATALVHGLQRKTAELSGGDLDNS